MIRVINVVYNRYRPLKVPDPKKANLNVSIIDVIGFTNAIILDFPEREDSGYIIGVIYIHS
jgi:hypothetical protein